MTRNYLLNLCAVLDRGIAPPVSEELGSRHRNLSTR